MQVHQTLGSYPGLGFIEAMDMASDRPDCGSLEHVQICPQNTGILDEALDRLISGNLETQFRLHANVRVEGHQRQFDASSQGAAADAYFCAMARINDRIGATVYTLHAGQHQGRSLSALYNRMKWLEDAFGCRVGVEGHYPDQGNPWWLATWEECRWLHESGLDFALDLSHLHIVANRSGRADMGLTREMLASEHCVEVHLSGNDGRSDLHVRLADCPRYWWHETLDSINPGATVFYEGNECRGEAASERVRKRLSGAARTPIERVNCA